MNDMQISVGALTVIVLGLIACSVAFVVWIYRCVSRKRRATRNDDNLLTDEDQLLKSYLSLAKNKLNPSCSSIASTATVQSRISNNESSGSMSQPKNIDYDILCQKYAK